MRLSFIIGFIVLGLSGFSKENDFYLNLIEQGHDAYDEGHYDSAITYYSQVVNADFQSASLFYNLGNAYFKNNELAPAIYYYEKGLKLAPADPDIEFNLEMANSQIADRVEKKPVPLLTQAYRSISSVLTPSQWGYSTVSFFVLALALLGLFLLSEVVTIKRLSFFSTLVCIFLFLVSFAIGSAVKSNLTSLDKAIVFTSTLNVKSEPRLTSADLFVIHEGTKVLVIEDNEDWSRIALPDGNEGWVQSVDIKTF